MPSTPLTIRPFLWRARNIFKNKEIVTQTEDGTHRYTYGEYAKRVSQLSNALTDIGAGEGNVIGTYGKNHYQHFETIFAIPNMGATSFAINTFLPDDHLNYIMSDADVDILFVDAGMINELEQLITENSELDIDHYIVMNGEIPESNLEPLTHYESFISGKSTTYSGPTLSEDDPATLYYTSGTTGKPKGLIYTHKRLWAHIMTVMSPGGYGISEESVVLQTVPFFHINGWYWPFVTTALGSKMVLPNQSTGVSDLARLIEQEHVTFTGGVPTIWIEFLEHIKEEDVDVSSLERIWNGGSAPPEYLIRELDDFGIEYMCASGMTETGTTTRSSLKSTMKDWETDDKYKQRSKAGIPLPGVEFKAVDENGEEIPWDGESIGELCYKTPWLIDEYYGKAKNKTEDFEEGWFKTGDLVTIDEEGYIDIVDRKDDMIKSGGEWISSTELENKIIEHDDITESAVVGVPHERWGERPIAFINTRNDENIEDRLNQLLRDEFPKWWTPDEYIYVDSLPMTSTEKIDKKNLRQEYRDVLLESETEET